MLPIPNTSEAVEFLRHWDNRGPWVLWAKFPDGANEASSFYPDEAHLAYEWVQRRQGVMNLYFHVNRAKYGLTKKANKADMLEALALHIDLDFQPNEDRQEETARIKLALKSYDPHPSAVVHTGNGFQAYWRIAPTRDLQDIEARTEHLARQFVNADTVHSIDHVMRLPGTINLPTKAKQARGAVPVVARLVHSDWLYLYDPAARFYRPPAEPELTYPAYLPMADLDSYPRAATFVDATDRGGISEQDKAINTILGAIERVRRSLNNRNDTLSREAFLCGTKLAASKLSEDFVFQKLFDAVPGTDRDLSKDADTIRRQLREGQKKPEATDPLITKVYTMAHTLLDQTPPLPPQTFRDALHILNSKLPDPLPRGRIDKIANRVLETHTNGR